MRGRPEVELGEEHASETHLLPLALRAAYDPDFVLSIFGEDYPTPDGTAVRDYIHVSDLARVHVLALERIETHPENLVLNLGTGRGYSVRELLQSVHEVSGKTVKVASRPRRVGDPAVLVADASRSHEALQWQPRMSDLASIVSTAASWYRAKAGAQSR
jgi:UDP-glucose 4-epimerase